MPSIHNSSLTLPHAPTLNVIPILIWVAAEHRLSTFELALTSYPSHSLFLIATGIRPTFGLGHAETRLVCMATQSSAQLQRKVEDSKYRENDGRREAGPKHL